MPITAPAPRPAPTAAPAGAAPDSGGGANAPSPMMEAIAKQVVATAGQMKGSPKELVTGAQQSFVSAAKALDGWGTKSMAPEPIGVAANQTLTGVAALFKASGGKPSEPFNNGLTALGHLATAQGMLQKGGADAAKQIKAEVATAQQLLTTLAGGK